MKITTTTVLLFLLACMAITYIVRSIKKENMGIRSALIWIILWAGIGFFSLFPTLLNHIMVLAQMQNRMFFIVIMAILILFGLVFNLSSRLEKMQRTLARIVQETSINTYLMENKNEDTPAETSSDTSAESSK